MIKMLAQMSKLRPVAWKTIRVAHLKTAMSLTLSMMEVESKLMPIKHAH